MKRSACSHLRAAAIRGGRCRSGAIRHTYSRLCVLGAILALGAASSWAQSSADAFGGGGSAGQGSGSRYTERLQSIGKGPGGNEAARALVVLSSSPDVKTQANLQEDLAVMYHILDKAIDDTLGSDQRTRNAMGVDLFFVPDSSHLRSAYFEGYGALFLFKVSFPLLPAANKAEAQKEEKQTNSQWEEARQEVFGDPAESANLSGVAAEPYSEERVNRLKSSLLEALKNAANIRDLKSDEGVTLCVLGGTKTFPKRAWTVGSRPGVKVLGDIPLMPGQPGRTSQRGTILTIRAKKADIDAFAKDQISLEEFQKKSRITLYEGDTWSGPGFGNFGTVGFGSGSYGPAK